MISSISDSKDESDLEFDESIDEIRKEDKSIEDYCKRIDNDRVRKLKLREFMINNPVPPKKMPERYVSKASIDQKPQINVDLLSLSKEEVISVALKSIRGH
jgi:hypothetical protein